METREIRRLVAHRRTIRMLRLQPVGELDPTVMDLMERFDACTQRLDEHAMLQGESGRTRTAAARDAEKLHKLVHIKMGQIAAIAKLRDMRHVAGIEALKHVPPERSKPAVLAAAARAMAKRIDRKLAREFERRKFEPGFVKQLGDMARALQAAAKGAEIASGRRLYATLEIKRLFKEASELREAIRRLLAVRLMRDSGFAVMWRGATHINRKAGRRTNKQRAAARAGL